MSEKKEPCTFQGEKVHGLKFCPFCRSDDLEIDHAPTYEVHHPDVYEVHCTECGGRGGEGWDEAEAIAAWNTRAEMSYEDVLILLDELGLSERTCRITEYDEASYPVCSECGAVQPEDFTVYYCWNCGRKVQA